LQTLFRMRSLHIALFFTIAALAAAVENAEDAIVPETFVSSPSEDKDDAVPTYGAAEKPKPSKVVQVNTKKTVDNTETAVQEMPEVVPAKLIELEAAHWTEFEGQVPPVPKYCGGNFFKNNFDRIADQVYGPECGVTSDSRRRLTPAQERQVKGGRRLLQATADKITMKTDQPNTLTLVDSMESESTEGVMKWAKSGRKWATAARKGAKFARKQASKLATKVRAAAKNARKQAITAMKNKELRKEILKFMKDEVVAEAVDMVDSQLGISDMIADMTGSSSFWDQERDEENTDKEKCMTENNLLCESGFAGNKCECNPVNQVDSKCGRKNSRRRSKNKPRRRRKKTGGRRLLAQSDTQSTSEADDEASAQASAKAAAGASWNWRAWHARWHAQQIAALSRRRAPPSAPEELPSQCQDECDAVFKKTFTDQGGYRGNDALAMQFAKEEAKACLQKKFHRTGMGVVMQKNIASTNMFRHMLAQRRATTVQYRAECDIVKKQIDDVAKASCEGARDNHERYEKRIGTGEFKCQSVKKIISNTKTSYFCGSYDGDGCPDGGCIDPQTSCVRYRCCYLKQTFMASRANGAYGGYCHASQNFEKERCPDGSCPVWTVGAKSGWDFRIMPNLGAATQARYDRRGGGDELE